MPGAGGTCASCGIPVRQETDDSLQCVRGYSGVRSAPPGRGGGHEDFFWCCNCLLKFRGVRSSTTPCNLCLGRTEEVWEAVKKTREDLEKQKTATRKAKIQELLPMLKVRQLVLKTEMNKIEIEIEQMTEKDDMNEDEDEFINFASATSVV